MFLNGSKKHITQDHKSTLEQMVATQETMRLASELGKVSELQDALNRATQAQQAFNQIYATSEALRTIGRMNALQNITPPPFMALPTQQPPHPRAQARKPTPLHTIADLGTAIRNVRKSQNRTQQTFADLAGVGRRFLSELEAGKPTLEIGKVLQVAAAAGIQLSFISKSDE